LHEIERRGRRNRRIPALIVAGDDLDLATQHAALGVRLVDRDLDAVLLRDAVG
jgi:hypothetical protein